jgi:DNA-binding LacI/PurR family transcriptional regulator
VDIGMDERQLPAVVQASEVDAWVIVAGSREILEWFSRQPAPAFALFGRMRRRSLAGSGPDKTAAYLAATRRLLELGHRRIVYVTEAPETYKNPGRLVGRFLDELEVAGIATGPYNVPDWEPSPAGLRRCLDALFARTPPTALLIDSPGLFAAAQQHLSRRGIHAPEQVSLICTDPHPHFEWCDPTIAHVQWDLDPIIRRAARWADNVARGKKDQRKTLSKARFIDGGTVGPAPGTRRKPKAPE